MSLSLNEMPLLLFKTLTNVRAMLTQYFHAAFVDNTGDIPVLQIQKALHCFKSRHKTGVSVMFLSQHEHITLLEVSVCKALSGRFL